MKIGVDFLVFLSLIPNFIRKEELGFDTYDVIQDIRKLSPWFYIILSAYLTVTKLTLDIIKSAYENKPEVYRV